MQTKRLAMGEARAWLAHGWSLFQRGRALWLAIAAVYLALALVLDLIPFVGILLVVLLTPIFAAGAFAYAAELDAGESSPAWPREGSLGEKFKALFARATQQLLYAAADPDRLLSLGVIATLLLGAAVAVQLMAEMLKVGGAALPAFFSGSVGPSIWLPALVSLAVVVLLKLFLTFVMLYSVQLVIAERHAPLTALEYAVNGAIGSALPLLGLGLALIVPVIIALGIGPLTSIIVGLIALPWLSTSLYRSYRDLYA